MQISNFSVASCFFIQFFLLVSGAKRKNKSIETQFEGLEMIIVIILLIPVLLDAFLGNFLIDEISIKWWHVVCSVSDGHFELLSAFLAFSKRKLEKETWEKFYMVGLVDDLTEKISDTEIRQQFDFKTQKIRSVGTWNSWYDQQKLFSNLPKKILFFVYTFQYRIF